MRITATAQSSGTKKEAFYALNVYEPFDFEIRFQDDTGNFNAGAVEPQPQDITTGGTIYQGESIAKYFSVTYNSPLAEIVTFSFSTSTSRGGIPQNIGGISPMIVPAQCGTSCPGTLLTNINSSETADYDAAITVTATGGGKTHSIQLNPVNIHIPPFDFNVMGWAWSDGIGWISFNSQNCDTDRDELMDRINIGRGSGDAPLFSANCPPDLQPDSSQTPIFNYGAYLDTSIMSFPDTPGRRISAG